MLVAPHPLDPNLIDFGDDHECYIFGDDDGLIRARVDREDYWHFCRWRWGVKYDKRGRKPYLYRTVSGSATEPKRSLYLHVAIQERAQPERPSELHTIVDHKNGDTLECRKENLTYVTPSQNCKNRRTESHRVKGKFARKS